MYVFTKRYSYGSLAMRAQSRCRCRALRPLRPLHLVQQDAYHEGCLIGVGHPQDAAAAADWKRERSACGGDNPGTMPRARTVVVVARDREAVAAVDNLRRRYAQVPLQRLQTQGFVADIHKDVVTAVEG